MWRGAPGCLPDLQQPRLISPIIVGCAGRAWDLPPAGSPQHSQPARGDTLVLQPSATLCVRHACEQRELHTRCAARGSSRDAAAAGQDGTPPSITPWLQPLSLGCPERPGLLVPGPLPLVTLLEGKKPRVAEWGAGHLGPAAMHVACLQVS